jgi:hypothetical protein
LRILGMMKFKSVHGGYLQSWTDNTIHASNPHQNQEETWFLVEVDPTKNQYALLNWLTGRYLRKVYLSDPRGYQVAGDRTSVQSDTILELIPGDQWGVPGRVCFRAFDGWTMATNKPGDNFERDGVKEGGEVYFSGGHPSPNDPGWAGWWWAEDVTQEPQPGNNIWTFVKGLFGTAVTFVFTKVLDKLWIALSQRQPAGASSSDQVVVQ